MGLAVMKDVAPFSVDSPIMYMMFTEKRTELRKGTFNKGEYCCPLAKIKNGCANTFSLLDSLLKKMVFAVFYDWVTKKSMDAMESGYLALD